MVDGNGGQSYLTALFQYMKTLLGKLDSVRRSKELGYGVATQARLTSHKFMGSVEKIFKNLPKPLEWRSFYNQDLPLLMDFCEEVQCELRDVVDPG
jgi:hypothetical protein